jgi:hypothetical protein
MVKLAAEGAQVVINDPDVDPATDTTKAIEAAGGTAVAAVGSMTEADFATRFVDATVTTRDRPPGRPPRGSGRDAAAAGLPSRGADR